MSITGGTSVPKSAAGPTLQRADGAGQALGQLVGDRGVDQRAGRGGALLAGERERGLQQRRDDVVEVGVGVDDDAVLAAHLGDDLLDVALARDERVGRLEDVQAGRAEPVKTIVWMRGSATSALPGSSPPGSRLSASCGTPPACSASTIGLRARGRLLGGLEHDGVAGRQRGGDHAGGDREREVERRDHAGDAAGDVAHRVALARHLDAAGGRWRARARPGRSTRGSRSPRRRRRRPPPTACPHSRTASAASS